MTVVALAAVPPVVDEEQCGAPGHERASTGNSTAVKAAGLFERR